MAGGSECGLRHALGFAADLWWMCIVNREPVAAAAKKLSLDKAQVTGAVRLLRNCRLLPSPERLAVVVMRDPGLDDADVAEIFGRSRRWAEVVRQQQDMIRRDEYIPSHAEWIDDGMHPSYPTPCEISERAELVRQGWSANRLGEPEHWLPAYTGEGCAPF